MEFAIVLPFIVLLLLGITEFSRALYQYNTLNQCVRDGSRYLAGHALFGSLGFVLLTNGLVADTQNLVVYGNTSASGSAYLPGWSINDVGVSSPDSEHVRVSATYQYNLLLGSALSALVGGGIAPSFTMHATVTMRAL